MAKSKSRISLRDVPPGMTRVRTSKGDHLRRSRGSVKKAKLNAALKKATVFVVEANAAAKLFKDTIDPHRKDLIDTSLWYRLLAMFRRQQTRMGAVDFGQLRPFEFHTRYMLDRILPVEAATTYDTTARTLRAVISYRGLPDFRKAPIDGYKLTAIVLFPNLKKRTAQTSVEDSGILPLQGKQSPFEVQFSVPVRAKTFVLCLRIDGYSRGKKYHTIATRGMRVVAAGTIAAR